MLDTENIDFFVPLEGYGEPNDDASKEEKKDRKHGLLNWFKLWVCINFYRKVPWYQGKSKHLTFFITDQNC